MPKPPHLQAAYKANGAATGSNSTNKHLNIRDIKCHICSKTKPPSEYANRQLQKLPQLNAYVPRTTKELPVCKSCTPKQVMELRCVACDKTKSTKHFNKNQRQDPDRARCKKCVTVNEARVFGVEEHVDSDDYTDGAGSDSDVDIDDDEPAPKKKSKGKKKPVKQEEDEVDIDASDSEKVIPKNGAKKTAQAASEATTTTTSVRQTPIVSGVNTPLSYSSIAATPVPSVRDAPNSNSGSNDGWQTATGSRSSKSNGWSNSNTPGTRTPATASFSRRGGFAKKEKASPTPYLMENAFYAPGGQAPMVQKKPMSEKKQIFVGAPADDSDWEE